MSLCSVGTGLLREVTPAQSVEGKVRVCARLARGSDEHFGAYEMFREG